MMPILTAIWTINSGDYRLIEMMIISPQEQCNHEEWCVEKPNREIILLVSLFDKALLTWTSFLQGDQARRERALTCYMSCSELNYPPS